MTKSERRCGPVHQKECDVEARMRSVLAVHHLNASEISWWDEMVEENHHDHPAEER